MYLGEKVSTFAHLRVYAYNYGSPEADWNIELFFVIHEANEAL